MEGPLLFLALLVRNILYNFFNFCMLGMKIVHWTVYDAIRALRNPKYRWVEFLLVRLLCIIQEGARPALLRNWKPRPEYQIS